ncbi:hypothetical protein [Curtobacterium sp. CFBP9011]|uniref:hypothetical protein n=1 Tax=Curtobacterium sp. CFBP9011 TaxID=3096530 RepID=UPI002A6B6E67|nr:hypothetical protein [Curtobacterium sp. CFBP9011]MDY1005741.1 hypothetical protein [Curtobacterium sp. CFBP9011]
MADTTAETPALPADLEDVRNSFERALTTDEARVIPAWLGTAWRKLQKAVPGLAGRLALEDGPAALDLDDVKDVLVAMVERKLRNPDMLRTFNGDTASFTIDSEASAGKIYVTDEERLALGIPDRGSSGMYSIQLERS